MRAQGKSPAQVVQRWAWQQNIVLNPRTHNIDYMRENLNIFSADFELTAGEMKEISTGIPIPACERESPDALPLLLRALRVPVLTLTEVFCPRRRVL